MRCSPFAWAWSSEVVRILRPHPEERSSRDEKGSQRARLFDVRRAMEDVLGSEVHDGNDKGGHGELVGAPLVYSVCRQQTDDGGGDVPYSKQATSERRRLRPSQISRVYLVGGSGLEQVRDTVDGRCDADEEEPEGQVALVEAGQEC